MSNENPVIFNPLLAKALDEFNKTTKTNSELDITDYINALIKVIDPSIKIVFHRSIDKLAFQPAFTISNVKTKQKYITYTIEESQKLAEEHKDNPRIGENIIISRLFDVIFDDSRKLKTFEFESKFNPKSKEELTELTNFIKKLREKLQPEIPQPDGNVYLSSIVTNTSSTDTKYGEKVITMTFSM